MKKIISVLIALLFFVAFTPIQGFCSGAGNAGKTNGVNTLSGTMAGTMAVGATVAAVGVGALFAAGSGNSSTSHHK